MGTEQVLPLNLMAVLEDVLQQHGTRLGEISLASRKIDEPSLRRYEAGRWLRKTVGVVAGKDLPSEPSEEEFRLGLRSGIILCNVINKVKPGSVSKIVEGAYDSVLNPDGAALSAFQYFENVRNFLNAAEELGLPNFEASDLEQGGKSSRVVNCVLALKSYGGWKQNGAIGSWKYSGNLTKSTSFVPGKPFVRKNSEPFTNPSLQTASLGEKSAESLSSDDHLSQDPNEAGSSLPLNSLVRGFLSDKKPEEIPVIVESMLCKVMEEFQRRLSIQNESMKTPVKDADPNFSVVSVEVKEDEDAIQKNLEDGALAETKMEEEDIVPEQTDMEENTQTENEEDGAFRQTEMVEHNHYRVSEEQLEKQQFLVEQQQRDIQHLKHTVHITKEGMQFLQMRFLDDFSKLGKHMKSLAHAASGYQKVLEENRKLYNQVQDLKGNIRVYCRVRPFLPGKPNGLSTVDGIDAENISILTPSKYGKEGRKGFSFNKVFGPSATQEEVFSDTQPLIRSVLDGYNVCIFAYGQTGSGKTFTMTGPKELTEEGLGVNYRALTDLFELSEQRRDIINYEITVQMLEIYNEQVRDLLAPDGVNKRLEIRNSSQNGINVPDANLMTVQSTPDVISLMNLGHKNRAVSSTAMNDRSSRSHSCLTVHVQGRDLTSGNIIRGSMHLVDLAGSERVDKSEVTGDRLKEAQHINKSLAALGDVIASLAQKSSHVPYRNSKLTQLLQDSLGGQAKTLMFVHISPEYEAVAETLSTLKFAERVATVELGAARVNKDSVDMKELKEQVANLKAALAKKKGEAESPQYSRPSTPDKPKLKKGEAGSPQYSRPSTPDKPKLKKGEAESPRYFRPSTPDKPKLKKGEAESPQYSRPSTPEKPKLKKGEAESPQYSRPSTPEKTKLKKGEAESPQYSQPSTPEKPKLKLSLSSQHSFADVSNGHQQASDGVGNRKIRKNSTAKPKRKSLDPQDLSRLSSPPWPSVTSSSASEKDDDKDSIISGDWVDKLIVNKGETFGRNSNHALQWELDNRQLPEDFYQTCLPDPMKVYPEQPYVKNDAAANKKDNQQECDLQRIRFEVGSTDDSDHEALTASSDCSETDMLWQVQVSKATATNNSTNGSEKKKKKSQLKSIKSAEAARSLIPSLIPPPTRKLPNGITPARHLSMMLDEKRRTGGNLK